MRKIYLTLISCLVAAAAMAQGWPKDYNGVMLQGFYWDSFAVFLYLCSWITKNYDYEESDCCHRFV